MDFLKDLGEQEVCETATVTEAQVTEALIRMKRLKLHENVVKEFQQERKLNLSESIGILYWLNEEENKMVHDWEKETGNLVYHVIKDNTEFGLCYSFLFVSQYVDEWEYDNKNLEQGYPFAYVTNDFCSEYGTIGIKSSIGGLIRTA